MVFLRISQYMLRFITICYRILSYIIAIIAINHFTGLSFDIIYAKISFVLNLLNDCMNFCGAPVSVTTA